MRFTDKTTMTELLKKDRFLLSLVKASAQLFSKRCLLRGYWQPELSHRLQQNRYRLFLNQSGTLTLIVSTFWLSPRFSASTCRHIICYLYTSSTQSFVTNIYTCLHIFIQSFTMYPPINLNMISLNHSLCNEINVQKYAI